MTGELAALPCLGRAAMAQVATVRSGTRPNGMVVQIAAVCLNESSEQIVVARRGVVGPDGYLIGARDSAQC